MLLLTTKYAIPSFSTASYFRVTETTGADGEDDDEKLAYSLLTELDKEPECSPTLKSAPNASFALMLTTRWQ